MIRDPEEHRRRSIAGSERARAAGRPPGRPMKPINPEAVAMLAAGVGVVRVAKALHLSTDAIRRARDAQPPGKIVDASDLADSIVSSPARAPKPARWTEGPRCPKCSSLLRLGKCGLGCR